MKSRIKDRVRAGWHLLTEIPGWPDAPLHMRIGRTVPIALPCLGLLMLLVWHLAWYGPRTRTEKEALLPLMALEDEISNLQAQGSDQGSIELGERSALAHRLVLEGAKDLPGYLLGLKATVAELGWDANFVVGDVSAETPVQGAEIRYLPVRGKLVPPAGADRFSTLLSVLERLSSSEKRIDLMRLAIRVDENRWQAVELNLRLVCPVIHEKSP